MEDLSALSASHEVHPLLSDDQQAPLHFGEEHLGEEHLTERGGEAERDADGSAGAGVEPRVVLNISIDTESEDVTPVGSYRDPGGLVGRSKPVGFHKRSASDPASPTEAGAVLADEDPMGGFGRAPPSVYGSLPDHIPPHPGLRATPSKGMKESASMPSLADQDADEATYNPTPQNIPPPMEHGTIGERHVLVMVGLPARGKTHMARRLARYLFFVHGAVTRVFNVGEYRRKHVKQTSSDFFDHKIASNIEKRQQFAKMAMDDMKHFLFQDHAQRELLRKTTFTTKCVDSGKVAFFDATNSTKERREWIYNELKNLPLKLIFVESICTDQAIIDKNIWDAKVNLPEYEHFKKKREKAFEDFKRRISNYEKVYEKMDEDHFSWIKLINNGQKVVINRIHGFLPGRIVQFLTNLHAFPHSFYLTRHGQSEYNMVGKIGGDSALTQRGEEYARALAAFADTHICQDAEGRTEKARLWTSSLLRTIQTARFMTHEKLSNEDGSDWIQMDPREYRNLDELYAGVCDGMTYEEIEQAFPDEFARRSEDKFFYRYPRGESYLDVLSRLDPLIMEMESYCEPLLIVGHQAVLRLIYGYFTGKRREDCPKMSIPLNTVIKLTPRTYQCEEERICLCQDISQEDGQNEPPSH